MPQPWKVAIIGGGPGGLAAAIALSRLNVPDQPALVDWTLYEKKPRISETGGGISLQRHTWRILELLGVADRIDARDFFRPEDGRSSEQRNAVTGVLISKRHHPDDTPPHQLSCRMVRAKLQRALLSAVDASRIRVGKKLVDVVRSPDDNGTGTGTGTGTGGVRLRFDDGEQATFDLVVGADGIRSVVRQFVVPGHTLQYNGQSAYRTVLRAADVAAINGIPRVPVFWQYVGGKYVFTCPLGGDDFELTVRLRPANEGADETAVDRARKASWGQPYDLNQLLPLYADFAPPLRALLRLAADVGGTQEFALFNGPRLTSCVRHAGPDGGHRGDVVDDDLVLEKATAGVALLGDASHPLSGAFGAGAGFAFEDAYTLARALAWAREGGRPLGAALAVYDRARSPHYANLYGVLDRGAAVAAEVARRNLPLHEEIAERVRAMDNSGAGWVYTYRADEVVEEVIRATENKEQAAKDAGERATKQQTTPDAAAPNGVLVEDIAASLNNTTIADGGTETSVAITGAA